MHQLYFQDYSPLYSPYGPGLMLAILPFVAVIAIWTLLVKGYALWVAAKNGQRWWFVALLVINTIGILEIIYLVWFSPEGSNKLNPRTPADTPPPQT